MATKKTTKATEAKQATKAAPVTKHFPLHFALEKETPGAVRYMEVDEKGVEVDREFIVIGTIYIRKTALKGRIPATLKITIEG
jgi:hypothetical protein